MTGGALVSVLLLGLTLGVLHAFDADHLMTISSLSRRDAGHHATVRYAAIWALGHGGVLVAIAGSVALLKWSLPAMLPQGAERLVGVILIVAGAAALRRLYRSRVQPTPGQTTWRERIPLAIGLVHGLAGSAAVLALIPAAFYQPVVSLAYVALFSSGVLIAMMAFGFALDRVQQAADHRTPLFANGMRASVGVSAIVMGAYWLQAA